MINIAHTDAAFDYAGRWIDSGTYHSSAWTGSQIRFKISGTTSVKVNVLAAVGKLEIINVNVDRLPVVITTLDTSGAESNSATFSLPDTGTHTVIIKLGGWPNEQWNGTSYIRFTGIDVDNTGVISAWNDFTYRVETVGNSWMATENDWPHFMSANYSPWSVAFGGAKASDVAAQYPYQSSGVANTVHHSPDVVLVEFGVNDYNAGVSTSAYKTNVQTLITAIRSEHSLSKIVLLQVPDNTSAGKYYGTYGTVLGELATENTNTYYVPTTPALIASLSWSPDTAHLSYAGQQTFASYVEVQLGNILVPPTFATTPGIFYNADQVLLMDVGLPTYTTPELVFTNGTDVFHAQGVAVSELTSNKLGVFYSGQLFQFS